MKIWRVEKKVDTQVEILGVQTPHTLRHHKISTTDEKNVLNR